MKIHLNKTVIAAFIASAFVATPVNASDSISSAVDISNSQWGDAFEFTETLEWRSLQPDENVNIELEAELGAPTVITNYFVYRSAPGSVFNARSSSTTKIATGGGACIYANTASGDTVFNLPVSLRDGIRVDYLRLYFYDVNASNSTMWFTVYDHNNSVVQEWSVSSTGDTGYGSALTAFIDHTIDNLSYTYAINWRPIVTGTTMQLCGARIAYRLPSRVR